MKMLMLVYRQSLDHELRLLFKELGVKGFTEAPKVFGVGEAGTAFSSSGPAADWPGYNSMILAAMEDEQAKTVAASLKNFSDRLAKHRNGQKVPMRLFLLPCERML
jgi:hypothetical protein